MTNNLPRSTTGSSTSIRSVHSQCHLLHRLLLTPLTTVLGSEQVHDDEQPYGALLTTDCLLLTAYYLLVTTNYLLLTVTTDY